MRRDYPYLARSMATVVSLCISCLIWNRLNTAAGQPAVREQATVEKIQRGNAACIECHQWKEDSEFAKFKSNEFIEFREGVKWKQNDPHRVAYQVLQGELALKMAKNLNYDVSSAPQCLTCHATDTTPQVDIRDVKEHKTRFETGSGVNCLACHGLPAQWQTDHYADANQEIPWRNLGPAEKAKAGQVDLRSPAVKAAVCVSCHVGNPAEHKIITHDMYAAGHPPLPPFDLTTFLQGLPPHWKHPTELKYFDGVQRDRWKRFHYQPTLRQNPDQGESESARNSAVGAIAAMKAEMQLLIHGANQVVDKKQYILDYARYDCYSCHHDLKTPSDRQDRGYADVDAPGRPPLRRSLLHSAQVVAKHTASLDIKPLAATMTDFDTRVRDLRVAATAKPFGKAVDIRDAANKLHDICDQWLNQQELHDAPIYTRAQSVRFLEIIMNESNGPSFADPEVAMLSTWIATRLALDINTREPIEFSPLPKAIWGVRTKFQKDKLVEPATVDLKSRSEWIREYELQHYAERVHQWRKSSARD